MQYYCPKCSTLSLEIGSVIQFAPDSRSDEIVLQLIACQRCGFRGVAVYEESHRGSLSRTHWEHTGYRVGGDELNVLNQAITACPDPCNPRCNCPVHILLGRRSFGRWVGFRGFDVLDSFVLRHDSQP